jgi:hypothetical protein
LIKSILAAPGWLQEMMQLPFLGRVVSCTMGGKYQDLEFFSNFWKVFLPGSDEMPVFSQIRPFYRNGIILAIDIKQAFSV